VTEVWIEREFTSHDFRDDDLVGLRTERAIFDDCDFRGVNLAESEHLGSAFRNCKFDRASLWHSTFRNCSLMGSVFTNSRLRPMVFDEVDFTLAVLAGTDLRGADLSGCRLREAGLVETDLRKAVLRGADLTPRESGEPSWIQRTCAARGWTPTCGRRRRRCGECASTCRRRWRSPRHMDWTCTAGRRPTPPARCRECGRARQVGVSRSPWWA
jgi:hypothetical protein